jgi:hypothetical protein
MKIKIMIFLILGVSAASDCFAQALEPGSKGESSSTGVWSSGDSGSTTADSGSSVGSVSDVPSPGYDSGNHGNVN